MNNINLLKIKKAILLPLFIFLGCKSDKIDSPDFTIKFINQKLYLKEPKSRGEYLTPPIIKWNFTIKNNTNEERLFTVKNNSKSSIISRFYLIDTIRDKILRLETTSIYVLSPKSIEKIEVNIPLKNYMDIFELHETYFNRLDYSSDSSKIKRMGESILKNSMIVYFPNNKDIKKYQITEKNNLKLIKDKAIIIEK
ncbi:hypothetical protein BAZ12_03715 [Elizabethkingia miricola]|uniref:Uncharacterized protein n=1 Tax=Elizabethkingia miricola TaxID=172045 RepID=A0ABD4DNB7_ELIMR|nr:MULTISPECIES: hypothetical protein [Elizabethkingia]KUY19863.1 hypothetical protein ATB95_02715 [Elizabethkingia miricola]MCL1651509.1 hypothetical protein [Elizabethkingia miricola]OPC14151.1 hypothetical protein BAY01_07055 [Elizabethkingia miricola]OPC72911.1 hypothetical protein BAZ12_03715 [Elizabethkingia miricola]OPC73625.1 hypothetical protein BAZ13_00870 [Elizabethkingia miricola]